ncbi:MAG TPA: DUF11 domain-containing protein, partial [Thermoanaerobaculia bacterium]|nr:DUF11 domain-containing protein [Thermoanaerobaculia bacterium]
YFQVAAFATADLAVTKTDTPDPVTAGTNLTYTITVTNNGPDPADTASWNDMLPAGTTFVSLSSVAGWSCTTPVVGAGGLISCTNPTFAVGSAMFTLTVAVDPATAAGTVISNTAGVNSATGEGNPGDESATATTTVAASADLSVTKVDTPDPVLDGQDVTYTITVTNAGPSSASTVTLNDVEPGGTSPAPLTPPAGWSCTPEIGLGFSCTIASMPPGQAVFTVVLQVGPQQPDGRILINTVDVSSTTPDPNGQDNTATAQTTVHAASALSATKTVSGSFAPGGAVTYTLEVTNAGPTTELDSAGNELTDVLPPSLQLVSATASSGTALATPGTNTVTWNGTLDAGASTTITIQATVKSTVAPGTTVSNQASLSWDSNGDLVADATAVSDDPGARGATDPTSFVVAGAAPAPIPTLDDLGLMLLALLLAAAGGRMLRRRSASL